MKSDVPLAITTAVSSPNNTNILRFNENHPIDKLQRLLWIGCEKTPNYDAVKNLYDEDTKRF